ncbi:MAG: hypothetical protein M9894_16260 [Planctomycetes bacterium]|nr:hypothetical protein [Planctomycetota bacterium]
MSNPRPCEVCDRPSGEHVNVFVNELDVETRERYGGRAGFLLMCPGCDRTHEAWLDARAWNARCPVGTPVRYWPGVREGEGRQGVTRSLAWVVSGHASVLVTGQSGSVALSHVEPVGAPA